MVLMLIKTNNKVLNNQYNVDSVLFRGFHLFFPAGTFCMSGTTSVTLRNFTGWQLPIVLLAFDPIKLALILNFGSTGYSSGHDDQVFEKYNRFLKCIILCCSPCSLVRQWCFFSNWTVPSTSFLKFDCNEVGELSAASDCLSDCEMWWASQVVSVFYESVGNVEKQFISHENLHMKISHNRRGAFTFCVEEEKANEEFW